MVVKNNADRRTIDWAALSARPAWFQVWIDEAAGRRWFGPAWDAVAARLAAGSGELAGSYRLYRSPVVGPGPAAALRRRCLPFLEREGLALEVLPAGRGGAAGLDALLGSMLERWPAETMASPETRRLLSGLLHDLGYDRHCRGLGSLDNRALAETLRAIVALGWTEAPRCSGALAER